MSNNKLENFISVVIPCYNDGIYLEETLLHVKKQSFQDYEIIIVNDGSTDPFTLDLLSKIDPEMATVLHKENGRMSSARNFGVKHAKGNIIVALDSDDYFEGSFFEKGLKVLEENPEVAVVTSYMKMFGKDNKISKPRGGDQYNFLFSSECPACAMVRKSCWDAVDGYDESMTLGYEDWEFYIRITQQNWTVHVIKEVLFFYRQTEKSTHKNKTLPNRNNIIAYIVNKHQVWYTRMMIELIAEKKVIYTDRRTPYSLIFKFLKDRLLSTYP